MLFKFYAESCNWKYASCYFIPIPIQRWSTNNFWDFFDNLCDNTGNMWVLWTREQIRNGHLLTLLILPYNLFKYSSAGNITTILAYQEVTNWNVHKFEASSCRPVWRETGTYFKVVLFWGPGLVSAQFLLTLPCKVHAFCVTKQLHFAVMDKQVSYLLMTGSTVTQLCDLH